MDELDLVNFPFGFASLDWVASTSSLAIIKPWAIASSLGLVAFASLATTATIPLGPFLVHLVRNLMAVTSATFV